MRNILSVLAAMAVVATASAARGDELAVMSDEFVDAKSLANWQRVEQVEKSGPSQLRTAKVVDGRLVLEPHASSWYRDYRGVLLFKPVTGDFVVTTKLAVSGRAGNGPPRSPFSLAGIMIRTPRDVTPQTWAPGGENYVFLSLGAADKPGTFQLEVKTTLNSDSQLQITDGAAEGELRAVRVGQAIILLQRLAGREWVVHRRYHRPDLPATLQVGLTCYTDWPTVEKTDPPTHNRTVLQGGNPDLRAEVDYVRFESPSIPQAMQGRNLADPAQVSDADLLAAFATP